MKLRPYFLACLFLFTSYFTSASSFAAGDARIESFSPTGVVRSVEQVTVRFSEPMVPLGDLRDKLNPFFVECPIKGSPRWLNSKEWVYDFAERVPAGIECKFGLRREVRTLSGGLILGDTFYSFSSGGPKIINSNPYNNSTVALDQVFILEMDGEVDRESVAKNAAFIIESSGENLGVKFVDGKVREEILRAQWRYRSKMDDAELMQRIVLLQAERAFPVDSKLKLIWSKEIQSKSKVTSDEDQIMTFKSRKDFSVSFSCTRENAQSNCSPVGSFYLQFSMPVPWKFAKDVKLRRKGKEDSDIKISNSPPTKGSEETTTLHGVNFEAPFAADAEYEILLPEGFVDELGTSPINLDRFPLTIRTAELPPLAKFAARFGIIESKTEMLLPVTLRSLEAGVEATIGRLGGIQQTAKIGRLSGKDIPKIISWMDRVRQADWKRNESILDSANLETEELEIPRKEDAKAFEVVGIPMKRPGLYIVEIESENLRALLSSYEKEKKERFYVPTMALVTNMAVHFKCGLENSLVWVTSLDQGKPVAEASVDIFDKDGKSRWNGKTNSNGIAAIETGTAGKDSYNCGQDMVIAATKGDDFSFVTTDMDRGIERYRFSLPWSAYKIEQAAHTVFGRTLLRAGETIHMKHFLRDKVLQGFRRRNVYPKKLQIVHQGSNKKVEIPLKWNAKEGTAVSKWKIPKSAHLGHYSVYFLMGNQPGGSIHSGSFQVEEFRIPLMQGRIQSAKPAVYIGDKVPVDFSVEYLNGGGAQDLPIRVRHKTSKARVSFPKYSGFQFGAEPLVEGLRKDSQIDSTANELSVLDSSLNTTGDLRMEINPTVSGKGTHDLRVEMEFRDPIGTSQTISRTIKILPSDRLVGIKSDSWIMKANSVKAKVAVVDRKGNAVSGASVSVNMYERINYSHRKRLIGGFYSYENIRKVELVEKDVCSGVTNKRGLLDCAFKSKRDGNFYLQAETKDSGGRYSFAQTSVWIPGKDSWWFSQTDHDRMDVIPEKDEYSPGDVAKFQVRMPFAEATALIAVEREGIIHTEVREVSATSPVIELPIKETYAPNMYVSVLAVRGRVNSPKPTAFVDLGRPAFKLGIAKIKVGWDRHRLAVDVETKQESYKVRDSVSVSALVKDSKGKPVQNADIMFAVVDKGLLELQPNRSWELLNSMMQTRGYAIRNYTAAMHVVGKRHFGLKAVAQGGGGGRQSTRELFDSLVFWKGSTKTNAKGVATAKFKLNDSLTSHRIVAVVNSGMQRFGTGSRDINVIQDISILPGVSPIARAGDQTKMLTTVRNMKRKSQRLEVYGRFRLGKAKWQDFRSKKISLQAGASRELEWEMNVPHGYSGEITYEFMAKAGKARLDRVGIVQKVLPAIRPKILQATLDQLSGSLKKDIKFPEDALIASNRLFVHFSDSIAGGLESVRAAMREYPHKCLEQRVSRAVVLQDKKEWQTIMRNLGTYQTKWGLLMYFPANPRWQSYGSETLTAYLLQMSHQNSWKIPDARRNRMLDALDRFVAGKLALKSFYPAADEDVRKIIALAAIAKFRPVRESYVKELKGDFNLWNTGTLLYWREILEKTGSSPEFEQWKQETDTILRSRLDTQGAIVQLRKQDSFLWWLMENPDTDMARLLINFIESPDWKPLMGRLVQGLFARQANGKWLTTTSDAWGTVAVNNFVKVWESQKVSGKSALEFSEDKRSIDWSEIVIPAKKKKSVERDEGNEKVAPHLRIRTETFAKEDLTKEGSLAISHAGKGKPWVFVQTQSAIPLKSPIEAGYSIEREVTPVEQRTDGEWSRGDIYQVAIRVKVRSDQSWVVVEDPIPGGASVLGSVGQNSMLDKNVGESKSTGSLWSRRAYPRFVEKGQDFYRAYYSFVPKGVFEIKYRVRLNNSGLFRLPATRVETMYNPEVFAATPNGDLEVK